VPEPELDEPDVEYERDALPADDSESGDVEDDDEDDEDDDEAVLVDVLVQLSLSALFFFFSFPGSKSTRAIKNFNVSHPRKKKDEKVRG
jgi:hypothetical protein